MERDLVRTFIKKDGTERIKFYQDVHARNPREWTDEPFHCEDWCRDYSIMNNGERKNHSNSARACSEYMLRNYGDYKKIISSLIDNGKKKDRARIDYGSCLVYDRSRKGYTLFETESRWDSIERDNGWYENAFFEGKRDDLDLIWILEEVSDAAIDYFIENCMTDGVKLASYGFGYYGKVSFYDGVSCDAEGICWLEKDEFLKYSGNGEEYWTNKTLREIEFLCDEIEAWTNNEVYGFVVEDCIKSKVHKEYTNVEREDEDYEETEWEETESCWGYYGEFKKVQKRIFDEQGINADEWEER